MTFKQLGRGVANMADEIGGRFRMRSVASKAAKTASEAGDDVNEAVSKATQSITDEVSEKVSNRRTLTKAEQEAEDAYNKAVKEAKRGTSNAAKEAVTTESWTYRQNQDSGAFEKIKTGDSWDNAVSVTGDEFKNARKNPSRANSNPDNNFEFTVGGSTNNLPMDIAQQNAESEAGFLNGISQWASQNQLLAAGIAAGGLAGTGLFIGSLADDE